MNTLTRTESITNSSTLFDKSENATGWFNGFINAFRQSRFTQMLTGLLAIQLVLSIVLGMQSSTQGQFATGEPLLSASIESINTIEIADGDANIQLAKQADAWHIEGETKLPVQPSKVNALLDSITTLKTGLPVASSESAQEQLKVSEDDFVRRLSLSGDGLNTTTLLLGTSPGLRKSHLRREDSREIYSASLPVSDLPSDVNEWLDKNLLAFSDVTSLESNGISFNLVTEGEAKSWTVSNPSDTDKKIDSDKIEALVNTLKTLRVSGVAESEKQSPTDDSTDTIEIKVISDKPETILAIEKYGDTVTVKRGDIAGVFTLTSSQFDQLSALRSVDNFILDDKDAKSIDKKTESVDKASG